MTTLEVKDPDEYKDYAVDWASKLQVNEKIVTSSWALAETYADAADLTLGPDSNTNTTATVWVDKGRAGQDYKVTNTITTDVTDGSGKARKYEETIIIPCRAR